MYRIWHHSNVFKNYFPFWKTMSRYLCQNLKAFGEENLNYTIVILHLQYLFYCITFIVCAFDKLDWHWISLTRIWLHKISSNFHQFEIFLQCEKLFRLRPSVVTASTKLDGKKHIRTKTPHRKIWQYDYWYSQLSLYDDDQHSSRTHHTKLKLLLWLYLWPPHWYCQLFCHLFKDLLWDLVRTLVKHILVSDILGVKSCVWFLTAAKWINHC